MGLIQQATEITEQAGKERNRYADFLRVLAIAAVVIGHWIVIDLQFENGLPTGINALAHSDWIHWGTWAFQVIPLFFLVGGYANAISWRRHRERGRDWASWLRRRSLRLLWPTAIFVAAGLILTPVAAWLDVPEEILSQATWAVALILWFLAVYLIVSVLTPLSLRAHERWGMGFVGLLTVLVIAADSIRFLGEVDLLAYANYALVWGAFHQLGFAWKDGILPSRGKVSSITGISFVVLFLLVEWGPYPVSMVGVPGAEIQNTGPPTLALLLLGFAQIGLMLLLRPLIRPRLEGNSSLWRAVVTGNLVIMSIFLWHVVPVVIIAVILTGLGVTLPGAPGSMVWLAFRLVWILMLGALLLPLVLFVRRGERPPEALESVANRQGRSRLALGLGILGVASASAGLARLALEGFWAGQPTLIPVWGAVGFFAGSLVAIGGGLLGESPEGSAR